MPSPLLLSPYRSGTLDLRNRVALAPMTRARAGAERIPNELMATYYAQRAGAGLLISEATVVTPQGIGWVDTPGIYSDAMTAGWRLTTDAVHAAGSTFFLQLWHCGRASHSDFHGGALPVSASAIKLTGDEIHTPQGKRPYETPRALETGELPGLVQAYVDAGRRALEAGCDGVEVHAANGYLLDQFLQSRTNHRSDGYGGSVANRFRLLREVVSGLSDALGADRVAVRLSPNGAYNDMGSPDFRETFDYAFRELAGFGLAYLHVVDGLAFGFHGHGEPLTLAEIRAAYSGTLVGSCGYTQAAAEAALERGDADLIAFGRPFINNPDLVERFRQGWPLNESYDMSTWYAGGDGARGYTDWPTYAG